MGTGRGPGVAARHAGTLPKATGRRPAGAQTARGWKRWTRRSSATMTNLRPAAESADHDGGLRCRKGFRPVWVREGISATLRLRCLAPVRPVGVGASGTHPTGYWPAPHRGSKSQGLETLDTEVQRYKTNLRPAGESVDRCRGDAGHWAGRAGSGSAVDGRPGLSPAATCGHARDSVVRSLTVAVRIPPQAT
jgi:hypothetical protein